MDKDKIEEGKLKFNKLQNNLLKRESTYKKEKINEEVTRVYLNAGKKKKIRVIDIVGALSNIEEISNEDIGVIELKDTCSYVDILNFKGEKFLKNNKEIIIKKKGVKVRKDKS